MNQVMENASSSSERAANAQLSAASSNERVSDKFEDIGRQLPLVQETLKDAAQVIASISGPISELKSYLEKLPDLQQADDEKRIRSADERDRRMLNMTSDLAEKVTLAAEQFGKIGPLADRLAEAAQNLDDAGNELAIFGKQVLDASQNQKEASVASRSAAISGENVAKMLSPLPQKIDALNAGLMAAGNSIRTGAETARDSYKELNKFQKDFFSGAETGLTAMKDRLNQIIHAYGDQIEGQTKNLMSLWTDKVTECLKTYQNQVSVLQGELGALQEALDKLKRR
jgi:chromosome segregation ATPase